MWNLSASSKLVQDRITARVLPKLATVVRQAQAESIKSAIIHRYFCTEAAALRLQQVQVGHAGGRYSPWLTADRQMQIRTNNAILVQRMMNQKLGEFHRLHNPVFGKQSLNRITSNRRTNQIVEDNKVRYARYCS